MVGALGPMNWRRGERTRHFPARASMENARSKLVEAVVQEMVA